MIWADIFGGKVLLPLKASHIDLGISNFGVSHSSLEIADVSKFPDNEPYENRIKMASIEFWRCV